MHINVKTGQPTDAHNPPHRNANTLAHDGIANRDIDIVDKEP